MKRDIEEPRAEIAAGDIGMECYNTLTQCAAQVEDTFFEPITGSAELRSQCADAHNCTLNWKNSIQE